MDIKNVAKHAGGVVAMSKALGLSRGAVSQWKVVPSERVLDVCGLTEWKVTPHMLRPDLYPNPGDALPAGVKPAEAASRRAPAVSFGEFGEPRSGADRRQDGDRRVNTDPSFGEFGECRDGDRRVGDRRLGEEGAA